MHSFRAIFVEVGASVVTGEVRVRRMLGAFDCGRILNAKTARSQFRGGMIMGISLALMGETQWDERQGRIMNPSLAEHHVPVHMGVPEIELLWTDIADWLIAVAVLTSRNDRQRVHAGASGGLQK